MEGKYKIIEALEINKNTFVLGNLQSQILNNRDVEYNSTQLFTIKNLCNTRKI